MRLLSLHIERPGNILLRLGRRNNAAIAIFTSVRIEGLCICDLGEHMLVSWTLGSSGMLHSDLAFVSEVLSVSADLSFVLCIGKALVRQNCCRFFLMAPIFGVIYLLETILASDCDRPCQR